MTILETLDYGANIAEMGPEGKVNRRGVAYLGEVWVEKGRYKSGEEVHGRRGQMERQALIAGKKKKRDFLMVRVWRSVDCSSNAGLWAPAYWDTRRDTLDSPSGLFPKDLVWRARER